MSLDDLFADQESENKTKYKHEDIEKLESIVEEYQERFPERLDIDFIETSGRMKSMHGKAYYEPDGKMYIRISEDFMHSASNERLRLVVLHEMVHIYLYQKGYNNENHSKYFRWILGRVGGSFTYENIPNKKWNDCIKPFIENDEL